jgi:hypothetical protein
MSLRLSDSESESESSTARLSMYEGTHEGTPSRQTTMAQRPPSLQSGSAACHSVH